MKDLLAAMNNSKIKAVLFEASLAGDGECFAFDVDATTYQRITGEDTARKQKLLYPGQIFEVLGAGEGKIKIWIGIQDLD